jgi:hypothetical protein
MVTVANHPLQATYFLCFTLRRYHEPLHKETQRHQGQALQKVRFEILDPVLLSVIRHPLSEQRCLGV